RRPRYETALERDRVEPGEDDAQLVVRGRAVGEASKALQERKLGPERARKPRAPKILAMARPIPRPAPTMAMTGKQRLLSRDRFRGQTRSGNENDLSARVALFELDERRADIAQRKGRRDRHVQLALGDEASELGEDRRVLRLLAALGLHPEFLRRGEVDDRIDAVLRHA